MGWVYETPSAVELTNAINAISGHAEEGHSVSVPSALSEMERIFVDAFVGNGGKGEEAALAAGYSAVSAKVSACRLLCRQRVAAQIKSRCETFAHAMLPVAVKALLDICETALLPKDRIKAANSLIELAGMVAPRGGVQVNVGLQVNGQQAQAIIASVHEARSRRLSDIPPAMPDTFQRDMDDLDRLGLPSPESIQPPPGGVEFQGPVTGSRPLPVPSITTSEKPRVSWPSGDGCCECADCRAKMKEGDDDAG